MQAEYLLSPYRTTDGELKKLLLSSIKGLERIVKLLLLKQVVAAFPSQAHPIDDGDQVEVIADTSSVSILVILLVYWLC